MSVIIELWVAALREPSRQKISLHLKRGNKFSATGILCEIYRMAKPDLAKWELDEFHYRSPAGWSHTALLLPDVVAQWAGLPSTDPMLNWNIRFSSLRPEDERNSAAALRDADKFKDAGDDNIKRIYDVAKKRRDNWELYRNKIASGPDSLLNIQNVIDMTFEQIAQVLTQNYLKDSK